MEIWKDIKGYEGLYQVSDLGRVKSLDVIRIDSIGREKFYKGRLLNAYTQKGRKRKVVFLSHNGKQQTILVHKLVMQAFVGEPNGLEICHTDGNEGNNELSNLRYDTKSENQIDIYRYGSRSSQGKLTPDEVTEIRHLLKNPNLCQKYIAKKYGISQQTVSEINTGRTFSWLDDNGDWRDVK